VESFREIQNVRPLTVTSGLRAAMLRAPLKIALRHEEKTRTYRDLLQRIDKVADITLGDLQLRPGQHALIVARNCIEYVELVCGLGEAGLTVGTITSRITIPELEAICDDAEARVVFTDAVTDPIARKAKFRTVERVIMIGDQYESWLGKPVAPSERPSIKETDSWVMGYTSGTTGDPKGALLSHRSRVLLILASAAEFGCFSVDDRYLAITPPNHGGGLLRIMASLFFGGYAEVVDKFDAEAILLKLTAGHFTSTALVPTHFHSIFSLDRKLLNKYRHSHSKRSSLTALH